MQWVWGVRDGQGLLRLRVGRGKIEQGLGGYLQTHRSPRVPKAGRLVCRWPLQASAV